jgi:hypothetical protein
MIPEMMKKVTSYSLLKEVNSTALTSAGSAAEYLLICPDCLIGESLNDEYKKCEFKQ